MNDPAPAPDPSPPARPAAERSILDRWFAPVRVAREAPERLPALAQRGTVVLVMRSPGLLELLFARWIAPQVGKRFTRNLCSVISSG